MSHLADAGDHPDRVSDVGLAVSELVANAFDHADAPEVRIDIGRREEAVEVVVTHTDRHSDAMATSSSFEMPEPSSTGGRGLAIVEAIAAAYDSKVVGRTRTTTLVIDGIVP